MDIFEFHEYERAALRKSPFEKWVEAVEKQLGHSLDGNQETDGYSLDDASNAFDAGITAQQYAAAIRTGVWPSKKPRTSWDRWAENHEFDIQAD